MKISEVHFVKEPGAYDYRRECLLNFTHGLVTEYEKHVRSLIRKAVDMNDLIAMVLTDEEMEKTQAYAEISKKEPSHWARIRAMLGEKQIKTDSDAGSLKVGTEACSMLIPNGRGDGVTRVAILERDEWNNSMLDFFTSIQGSAINVYGYDCGEKVVRTISGRYGIFRGEGFVVLEKWD